MFNANNANTEYQMAEHLYQFTEEQLTEWLSEVRAKLANAKANEQWFWNRKAMAYTIALKSKKSKVAA